MQKMQFNQDRNKQANGVIFLRKSSTDVSYPTVKFSNNNIVKCSEQKHLGVVLDAKLNLDFHINQKIDVELMLSHKQVLPNPIP